MPPGLTNQELETRLDQPELLRAKGFAETTSGIQLVQVVGRRIELSPVDEAVGPELLDRIVLIRRAQQG